MSVSFTVGHRSDNFIVGLTNNHPAVHAPVLWNYTLCGQYPGAVPNGATVSVHCNNAYEHRLRFQYVIVQFPAVNEPLKICEIEVFMLSRILLKSSLSSNLQLFYNVLYDMKFFCVSYFKHRIVHHVAKLLFIYVFNSFY